jgi:hypothetical protein
MSQHASSELLHRYAGGDRTLAADVEWALEVHLESCADCRARLAGEAAAVVPLVEQVWAAIEPPSGRPAKASRLGWFTTWATPAMVPWLAMTTVVALLAVVIDRVFSGAFPSITLLLAPVAPVAGVAAAWAKGLDPAHELVAATPRAGLYLVLRRTVAVLVVVIPLMAVATWTSPVRWLLPCLAFTVATLALGGFVGVRRAAVGLVGAWTAFVVGPSLVTERTSALLEPAALGIWAAVLVTGAVVVRLRATVYTRLES